MRTAVRLPVPTLAIALLLTASLQTAGAEGLQLPPLEKHSLRWQARVQLSSLDNRASGRSVLSANLLGDYYLTGSLLGASTQGGLRTTGGVLMGSAALSQSSSGLALRSASLGLRPGVAFGRRHISLFGPTLPSDSEASEARPYLGIGYTGQSLRSGWGFSADLGLAGQSAHEGLRLGRSAQSLDDLLKDLQLRPVLQLGLSYSF
ncbi:MAG TPA: hypothetical protein VJN44_03330 [Roseateles sp.]|nr:hypothetical protein [Roseateles sp.]